MIKELFQQTVMETALNIKQSKIEAVMTKRITKSGCRVYHDGFIGIAGALGQPNAETWKMAEANLSKKIAYPYQPESNCQRVRDLRKPVSTNQEFIHQMEDVLATLRVEYPDFIFSNKIKQVESEARLSNDAGLDFVNLDRTIEFGLLVKHVDSVNIFDTAIMLSSRSEDYVQMLKESRRILEGYKSVVEMPKKDQIAIILHPGSLLGKIIKSLNGETIGLGTSLFCDKMGIQAFSPQLNVWQERTAEKHHYPFFDMEGVVNPDDRVLLIDQGVIKQPYTDKKQAATFGFPLTGAAAGGYDDVPSLGFADLTVEPTQSTLQELLQGEYGIVVVMASGGDYSNEGNFGSPVQMAYLTDGVDLLGRLPELKISGNLYDMFGKNFIGVSRDKPLMGERVLVTRMSISK